MYFMPNVSKRQDLQVIVKFERICCTLYQSTNHSYVYVQFEESEPCTYFGAWF